MLKGVETVIYYTKDLKAATKWYKETFNLKPNHESSHYVGFTVCGYELGLHPLDANDALPEGKHQTAYWTVADLKESLLHLTKNGAKIHHDIMDVGGGVQFAEVLDPFGNIFGIIQNPTSPNNKN